MPGPGTSEWNDVVDFDTVGSVWAHDDDIDAYVRVTAGHGNRGDRSPL
jgi:hypothetical protein